MSELLPGSIADERFQRLDRVAASRFDGIDLTALLVMLIDHVGASALPALGWQFGALDEAWQVATEAEKRELLKRVLARHRVRGTPWAVRDALAALGHDSVIVERPQIRHDGHASHDGTFVYRSAMAFYFWAVVTGVRDRDVLRTVVDRWKRKSTRGEVYFVDDVRDASETLAYSVAPIEGRTFDETFDYTFS
jgi:hypothetical protein